MSAERRQTIVEDFPDDRRAVPDRRRQDLEVKGQRLFSVLRDDSGEGGGNPSPFPSTTPASVDILPILIVAVPLLIWLISIVIK